MYKITMIFQLATATSDPATPQKRIGGWTESFYSDGTLQATKALLNLLCSTRAALLPTGSFIKGQRIQQVSPKAAAATFSTRYPGSAGVACDVPQMALKIRIPAAATTNARNVEMRGIPDARVVEGEYQPSQAFTASLHQYLTSLRFAKFKAVDLTNAIVPVMSVTPTTGTAATVLFDAAPPVVEGDTLQLMNATDENGFKASGRYRVTATSGPAHTATIVGYRNAAVEEARARKYVVVYPTFADDDPPRVPEVVVRKVGRPSSGYRGRASRRR